MKKRFLAFVLSVCLMATQIPTAWAADKGYTINGTTVTAASGTAVGNCSTYASQVLRKIWTVGTATMTTYNSRYNLLKGKSATERELTQTHTKEYIQQAPLGSRIRICASSDTATNNYDSSSKGHTLVLVAKNDTAGTFTVLHAGWGAAEARTYTYQEFVNVWANNKGYHYFFYIADYSAAATNKQNSEKTVPSVTSTVSGKWIVTIPANYKVLCYDAADSMIDCDYRKPRENTNTITCIQKATLSNGSTRYYYVTSDNRGLWFDFISTMTVKEEQNIYTVTFNANGGNVPIPSMRLANGAYYTLPNPTRSGYAFEGWYTEKSGGSKITPTTTVNLKGNQTLYAHWTKDPEKMCTVTFDADGGTVGTKTMQVPVGGTLNTLPIPTRPGHIFLCWITANTGGSGPALTQDNYDWLIFDKDTTLQALWKEVEHTHINGDYFYSDSHPHYKYYTCVTCGEVYTDGSTINISSCATCNPPKKEEPQKTGHWGPWSSWTTKSYTASDTREVETKEVQTVAAHMEYRYGRYVDQTGTHNCWCSKYLEGLSYISGKAKLEYSNWSTTRYSANGSTWTCGQCNGKHTGVDHVDGQGRSIWKEYRLPGNKPYYWEEARTVGAQYETQYRYRDWIVD